MKELKTNFRFILNRTDSLKKMLMLWLALFAIINHGLIIKLAAANHPYFHCYPATNDADYFKFRNDQLSTLAANVKGEGGLHEETYEPYCLGFCRKDLVSFDACNTCLNTTASAIIRSCPEYNAAVAWGADAGCIAQCTPENSGSDTTQLLNYSCNATSISTKYMTRFRHAVANLTSALAVKAGQQGFQDFQPYGFQYIQYFADDEAEFSDLQTVYAAGFCVPSLSKDNCTACLKSAANQSAVNCNGSQGAMIFMADCVLRYELYPFYKKSATATPIAPSPPISPSSRKKGRTKRKTAAHTIVLAVVAVVAILVFIIGIRIFLKKRKQRYSHIDDTVGVNSTDSGLEFSLKTIRVATNDFSESNKLGQGGFGVVYKGRLPNGQLIAVKRLTRATAHGNAEFKNEVQLVARLHHKNLIRLIGFCLGAKERILIYELALKGSLDHILFVSYVDAYLIDPNRREDLTWKIRYNIIEGITHGLLYLHEESQLRIIHRDLKAGNILLDEFMNSKISDFGTARLFVEDQESASRIVGTYGYMPPEYAKFGKISTKIDVFSFGVLLLEIIGGRKNNASSGNPNRVEHLLSKVWKCWTSRKLEEVIDPVLLRESEQEDDIRRCIHIGLLCVQEVAASRPTMNEIILLLEGGSRILPPPSEPAYLMDLESDDQSVSRINDSDTDYPTYGQSSLSSAGASSVNEVSFTNTYPTPR